MNFEKLPKIDLHCHLDGSLSLSCIQNILNKNISIKDLSVDDDCKNLTEYLNKFNLPLQALQTPIGLKNGSYNFIKELTKENIKYIEVRFAPQLSINEKLSQEEVVNCVIEGLEAGKKDFDIDYNIILCLMRGANEKDNANTISCAKTFLNKGVCAIDLAGDESIYPMFDYLSLFGYAKSLDIPFTIHAGECGSVKNVLDAVDIGAKRIGHGIALMGDIPAQNYLIKKHIGIEMCPISNQQTKTVSNINLYPMNEFMNSGMLITINTDNRTVSNTTITKELNFIQKQFNITDNNIIKLMNNAIEVSFADDAIKNKLYEELSNFQYFQNIDKVK